MKLSRKEILALRRLLEAFVAQSDDATASILPKMSPKRKGDGALIKAGTRICEDGTVYKAVVDLWDTEANSPTNAPTLWMPLAYRDGYRIIPDSITVAEAFSLGERGWWNDVLYESTADNNVYTPEQYAPNWKAVE